jgi:hypothetical protein
MVNRVTLQLEAKKALRKVPQHVARKMQLWVTSVVHLGLETVRKQPGYHDEPLREKGRGNAQSVFPERTVRFMSYEWMVPLSL